MTYLRISTVAALFALASGTALAHHPSPAEPEIGDMMGMHETTVDAILESGMGAGYLENRDLPDDVDFGAGIDSDSGSSVDDLESGLSDAMDVGF